MASVPFATIASAEPTHPPAPAVQQQQPAEQQQKPAAPTLKKDRGLVKSVLSGDTIVVWEDKPFSQGKAPNEKIITLSSLSAPRMARGNEKGSVDEAFAFESREFLRKKVVGKRIQFSIDHATPSREYVTVYLAPAVSGGEPECLNHTVVSEGWASVQNKDAKRVEALKELEDAAVAAGKGIHNKEKPKAVGKNDEDADTLFRQLKGKPVQAIVEQVRTGTAVRVTILPSRHSIQVFLSGAQSSFKKNENEPKDPIEEAVVAEAKHFVESHVLNREVTLTINGVAPGNANDKQVSFSGSIEYQGHDVSEELLKAGLAKYVAYSAAIRGPEWVAKLKAAEQAAKDARRRIHSAYVAKGPEVLNGDKVFAKEFTGRVINVINTGAFVVIPEGANAEVQVNLSTIKVPKAAHPNDEANDKKEADKAKVTHYKAERYWAAEGKELLRKRLIGQKVRVVHDYTNQPKKVEGEEKVLPAKAYYTAYQNDQNIAVILVESGLAQVMTFKGDAERSVDFEVLLMAESKAKAAHKGLYSPDDKIPARRLNDLCIDNDEKKRNEQIARAKGFLQSFERAGPMKAIVDYVFSGARFKVTVPKQSTVFMFSLSSLKVPRRGDNEYPDADALSNAALLFSRDKLHQLEVTLEVNGVDQGGNFNGQLYLGKKNFSLLLLENGYAKVLYPDKLKDSKDFLAAEESAKSKRLGVWKNYDPEAEKAKAEAEAAASGEVLAGTGKVHEFVVTEVVDGSRVYIQQVSAESAGLEELVNQLTELSVSETGLPPHTPKAGEYVRAQFSQDDRWYRAKVNEVNNGKFKVTYVDYGNSEVVPQAKIKALPEEFQIKKLPEQAQRAYLAFIKPLKEDNDNALEARELLKDIAGGRKFSGTIEYKDANGIYVSLVDKEDGDLNVAVEMVRAGLARVERRKRHYSNPAFQTLKEAEEEAKRRRVGIWYYGDIPDSDEDEKEVPKKAAAAAPRKK